MADKKSLIDLWMNSPEDQPVGTAGMFNPAPDPQEVEQTKQAASDWWDWRNAKGWDLNPRDVAEGLVGQPLGALAVPHFAEGGTVMDNMKQGFMQPPGEAGALPIEKADTVPAKLSEGEFVIPAEEVRWHGLKTFMQMKLEAEEGLRTMESMGQIREPGEAPQQEMMEAPEAEMSEPGHFATGGLINKRPGLSSDYNLLNPDTKVLQDQNKNSFFIPPPGHGSAGDPTDSSVGGVNEGMTIGDALMSIGSFLANPPGFVASAMINAKNNPNMTTVPSLTTTLAKEAGLIDKDPTDYGFMPALDREKDTVTLDTDPAFGQPPDKSMSDTFKDQTDNAVKDAAANFGGVKGDPNANVSNDPVNGMMEGSLSNPTSPAVDADATKDGSAPSGPSAESDPSNDGDSDGSDAGSDGSDGSDGGDGDGYAKGGLIKRPKRVIKKK